MAGMEQVKSDSQCHDMADTDRSGTNAAWHLMPHNAANESSAHDSM